MRAEHPSGAGISLDIMLIVLLLIHALGVWQGWFNTSRGWEAWAWFGMAISLGQSVCDRLYWGFR